MSKLLQILETNINIKAQLKDSIEINEVGFEFFHIQEITFQDKDEVPRREALENVLIPYTQDENVEMLKNAGFKHIEIIFRWCNFATFLALYVLLVPGAP